MKPLVIGKNDICQFDEIENPIRPNGIVGHGGNGVVISLKCQEKETGYVAKVLKLGLTEERYNRFVNEIKIIEGIEKGVSIRNHILPIEFSHIPKFKEYQKGEYVYYVMERYESVMVNRQVLQNQNAIEITRLLQHILIAIRYLHNRGMAHRDIKLDNVLKREGNYFLTDFGLVVSDDPDKERLTRPNENTGPIGAPVETKFRDGLKSDVLRYQKTDIYLFGKLCWQLVTGSRYMFEGELVPGGEGYRKLDAAIQKSEVSLIPLIKLMSETIVCSPDRRCNLDRLDQYLTLQTELLNGSGKSIGYGRMKLSHYLMTSDYDGFFIRDSNSMRNILKSIRDWKATLTISNKAAEVSLTYLNDGASYLIFQLNRSLEIYITPKRLLFDNINSSIEIELDDCPVDAPVLRNFDESEGQFKLMSWMKIQISVF